MKFLKTMILALGLVFVTSCAHKTTETTKDGKACAKQCKMKKSKTCHVKKDKKKCKSQCKLKKKQACCSEKAKSGKCTTQCKLKHSKKS